MTKYNFLKLTNLQFLSALKNIKEETVLRHPLKVQLIEKTCLGIVIAYGISCKIKQEFNVDVVPKAKVPLYKSKWKDSNENTIHLQLLQSLALKLISEKSGIKPFWNSSCDIKTQKLTLLNHDEYQVLHTGVVPTTQPSNVTGHTSNYWMKMVTTKHDESLKFAVSPEAKLLNNWDITNPHREIVKARKIRLLPNTQQKATLNKWFGTCRYVYNRALDYINETNEPYNKDLISSLLTKFVTLNSHYRNCSHCQNRQRSHDKTFTCENCEEESVSPKSYKMRNTELKDWGIAVPKDIRQRALSDLTNSFKTCFSQLRTETITKFRHSFRSKKNLKSMSIGKEHVYFDFNKSTVQFTKQSMTPIKYSKNSQLEGLTENEKLPSDARIQFDGVRYWLIYTTVEKDNLRESPAGPNSKIVSLDPGARKFMAFYSETQTGVFHRDSKLMKKIWTKIDLLKSLRSKGTILKNQARRKILKLNQKMKNIVSDLHWKTANFLCNSYTDILLPEFATRKKNDTGDCMMSRLHRTTNRSLDFLSHYQFKNRLLHVASQHRNCSIHTVGEAYTSKTCTKCGFVNKKDGKETLKCAKCHYLCDRDYIGSRNVFIKNTVLV